MDFHVSKGLIVKVLLEFCPPIRTNKLDIIFMLSKIIQSLGCGCIYHLDRKPQADYYSMFSCYKRMYFPLKTTLKNLDLTLNIKGYFGGGGGGGDMPFLKLIIYSICYIHFQILIIYSTLGHAVSGPEKSLQTFTSRHQENCKANLNLILITISQPLSKLQCCNSLNVCELYF